MRSTDRILYLSDFNFDSVISELNVQPHQKAIIKALRFIYNRTAEDIRRNRHLKKDTETLAARRTIDESILMHGLINSYIDELPEKDKKGREALIVTAMIGDWIVKPDFAAKSKIFHPALRADIHMLQQEAENLLNGRPGDFDSHSIFLAQLRSMQFIDFIDKSIEQFTLEELQGIFENNIPVMEDLADQEIGLGRVLYQQCMTLRDVICERMYKLYSAQEETDDCESDIEPAVQIVHVSFLRKENRSPVHPFPVAYITNFNEVAVYDQLSIEDNEEPARASVRFLFSALVKEVRPKTLKDRKDIIEAVVKTSFTPYYLASEMSQEFTDDDPYHKDALVVAAICENNSCMLEGKNILDAATIKLANIIAQEAIYYGLTGQPELMTLKASKGLTYILAVKLAAEMRIDLPTVELEEEFKKMYEALSLIRHFMRTDNLLGCELQEALDLLHNDLLAYRYSTPRAIDQAKNLLERKTLETDVHTLLTSVLYANDLN